MGLDRSKKYEFAGEVYAWTIGMWRTQHHKRNFSSDDFQLFYDNYLTKEHREPIAVDGVISFDACGSLVCDNRGGEVAIWWRALPLESRQGRTFRVTWTEVVE